MELAERSQDDLPIKPPILLFVIGLVFLIFGTLTSDIFDAIDVMRSVNSEIPSVRNTAVLIVRVFRIFCLISFALVSFLLLFWRRFCTSAMIRKIMQHQPAVAFQSLGINSVMNLSFLIIVLLTSIGLLLSTIGFHIFTQTGLHFLFLEDGLIEQATALIFLACSFFSGILAIKVPIKSNRFVYCIFAVGFFFCFGEEISWGQRIFGFKTPESLSMYNLQGEFTLHNLYHTDSLFLVAVFIYGFVFPLLAWISPFWLKLFDKISLPIPSPGLAIGFLLITTLDDRCLNRLLSLPYWYVKEFRELLFSIGFLLLISESWKSISSNIKTFNYNPRGMGGVL